MKKKENKSRRGGEGGVTHSVPILFGSFISISELFYSRESRMIHSNDVYFSQQTPRTSAINRCILSTILQNTVQIRKVLYARRYGKYCTFSEPFLVCSIFKIICRQNVSRDITNHGALYEKKNHYLALIMIISFFLPLDSFSFIVIISFHTVSRNV